MMMVIHRLNYDSDNEKYLLVSSSAASSERSDDLSSIFCKRNETY